MVRRQIVGGNWKCNGTLQSIDQLIEGLNQIECSGIDVFCAPVSIHLPRVLTKLQTGMAVCSQNISPFPKGAYTGEVTPEQLLDMGVPMTIVGHSERRKIFLETDEMISLKVARAQEVGLPVVFCLGETDLERKEGRVEEVLLASLKHLTAKVNDWSKIVIAYEPVWAIGTGNVCSPEIAQEVCSFIRRWLKDTVDQKTSENTRVIYGGSVKPKNAKELIAQPDVDGFLVGGASLKPMMFRDIIKAVRLSTTARL